MSENTPTADRVIAQTRAWVQHAVVGLNLCPFAKAPLVKGQVRFVVCESDDPRVLLDALCAEMRALAQADPDVVETTLLVHPNALVDFDAFNDFLDAADAALEELQLDGVLQVASFHPHYRFAGTEADDLGNATNRSPHPTLHLLREASVERAVASFPQAGAIFEANIATLEALGADGWAALQAECRAAAPNPPAMLQFADIERAAVRIKGVAHRTPVLTSRTLDALLGLQVFMKAENLQRMGAFKFRGGYNAVNALTDAQRANGVVAFSSGNHAQAIALAAQLHGCAATIVMPHDAPALKLAATRGYGAEVVVYDRYTEDRALIAKRLVDERDATLIPPFDCLAVMAGQGTAALELIEDVGALDALIVCAGGGGFLSGCAVAAKHLLPQIEVYGAEPERGNDMQQSLRAGRIVSIEVPRTICDGQQTQAVGKHPFEVIRAHVTEVLTASDPAVVEAMRFAFERLKVVLEPSGACALAALMKHADRFRGRRVGITLSGGNIGLDRFVALVSGAENVD